SAHSPRAPAGKPGPAFHPSGYYWRRPRDRVGNFRGRRCPLSPTDRAPLCHASGGGSLSLFDLLTAPRTWKHVAKPRVEALPLRLEVLRWLVDNHLRIVDRACARDPGGAVDELGR